MGEQLRGMGGIGIFLENSFEKPILIVRVVQKNYFLFKN